jgi:nicotinate dehydrogenase subunit A
MQQITLQVNRTTHTVEVDPDTPLLFVLNDELGLRGPRFGCGMAQCGACTVIMRGQVVRSCVMPVRAVGQAEITTLEGLGTPGKPHPIQQAFIDEGVLCRCFAHVRMLRAIRKYAEAKKHDPVAS